MTLSTTRMVKALLEVVAEDGTYGKNAAEAANWLLGEKLRELKNGNDTLAVLLRDAQENMRKELRLKNSTPND